MLKKYPKILLFSPSSWRILRVGRVGSLQRVLWFRSSEEAETLQPSSACQRWAPLCGVRHGDARLPRKALPG